MVAVFNVLKVGAKYLRCNFYGRHRFLSTLYPVPPNLITDPVVASNYNVKSALISEGSEEVRGSILLSDPLKPTNIPDINVQTVPQAFYRGYKIAKDTGACYATIVKDKVQFTSYKEAHDTIMSLGSAIQNLGLEFDDTSFVGIHSGNRKEQTMTYLACSFNSIGSVPIYTFISPDNFNHILEEAEVKLLFFDTPDKVEKFLTKKPPKLQHVVVMENCTTDLAKKARKQGIRLWNFDEFLASGRSNLREPQLPKPDDTFILCYTSGTTGTPKGVIMTHKNILCHHASFMGACGPLNRDGGLTLSYLPPAHIYEVVMQLGAPYHGRALGFYSGDPSRIIQDMQLLQPTIIPFVPRMMNRVYEKAMHDINSNKIKRNLLDTALEAKEKLLQKGTVSKSTVWDISVFDQIQKDLGGKQELIIVGAASSGKQVVEFFQRASGACVFEFYGQSESVCTTGTLAYETQAGFIGAPTPGIQIKLKDVPDLNYFSKDGVGEICIKGVGVTPGYFKKPKETEESKDGEWQRSGDIAKWLPNGYLQIIDRKKHIFKLSQGEYIAPEKIEGVYSLSPLVTNMYVDGLPDKDYVVAIVVPEEKALVKLAESLGITNKDYKQLCEMKELRSEVLKQLRILGKDKNLNSLEQAKNLMFHTNPFTIENDLLTPTLKFKRSNAAKIFKSQIVSMYKESTLI